MIVTVGPRYNASEISKYSIYHTQYKHKYFLCQMFKFREPVYLPLNTGCATVAASYGFEVAVVGPETEYILELVYVISSSIILIV